MTEERLPDPKPSKQPDPKKWRILKISPWLPREPTKGEVDLKAVCLDGVIKKAVVKRKSK